MSVTIQIPQKGVLLTVDDIRHWKGTLRSNSETIARLSEENHELEKKLQAASLFFDVSAVEEASAGHSVAIDAQPSAVEAPAATPSPFQVEPEEAPRRARRRSPSGEPGWADIVLSGVQSAEMGITYAELRRFVASSTFGEKLQLSDKGYHNAISRLVKDKVVIREHGRLFSPPAFGKFVQAVAEGKASKVVPMPFAHSPMGEAILKIVQARPGIIGKEIIGELRKNVEFNATLTPHETGAYNIIARLVKRRQIIRRDDGGCIVGPDFPHELIGQLPDGDGALNGHAASAPVAGGTAIPPIESQTALRLIG